MKYIIPILLLAITAQADDFTLFNVAEDNTIPRLERVRSIPNLATAQAKADQVRDFSYRGLPYSTNVVQEVLDGETNTYNVITYATDTPQKYWLFDGADIYSGDDQHRNNVDVALTNNFVVANTKTTKQLRAEERVVELVTNAWPAITFPLSESQLADMGDLILIKVNTQRLDYGTQANAQLIGQFIADTEALSDLAIITDYIENVYGSKPTDPTFGRQVEASDYEE